MEAAFESDRGVIDIYDASVSDAHRFPGLHGRAKLDAAWRMFADHLSNDFPDGLPW